MKYIKLSWILLLLSSIIFAQETVDLNKYERVITIDRGVERVQYIPKASQNTAQSSSSSTINELTAKLGLIIEFSSKDININQFENKYDLSLQTILINKYYVFYNKSKSTTDIGLMRKILENDKDKITTINPNWSLKNKPL